MTHLKLKSYLDTAVYAYSTARVNCADEFHTLRRRVVRRVCTIFLRARSKKMRDSCAFVIHGISFLCISMLYETKDF